MTDDPRIDPADLRQVKFPGSGRRYDSRAVDQFLETVAARVAATNVMVDELRQQLDQAQNSTPPPAEPVADLSSMTDDDLVRRLGQETATVLLTARRSADEIRRSAREEAAEALEQAAAQVESATEAARERAARVTSEAEAAAANMREEAARQAEHIVRDATELAEQVRSQRQAEIDARQAALDERLANIDAEAAKILVDAREEARAMVAAARESRSRMLEDLRRRRDLAEAEIERLLSGRDRLLAAYELVRQNLDEITNHVSVALALDAEPPDGFSGAVGESTPSSITVTGASGDEDGDDGRDDTIAPSWDSDASPAIDSASDDAELAAVDMVDAAAASGAADAELGDVVESQADEDGAGGELAGHDEGSELVDGDAEGLAVPSEADQEPSVAAAPIAEGPDDTVAEPVREALSGEADMSAAATAPVDDDEDPETSPGLDDASPASAVTSAGLSEVEDIGEPALVAAAVEETAPASTSRGVVSDRLTPRELHGGATDQVSPAFLADDEDLGRRSEALAPLGEQLERALKRQLADEQNELLDLVRRSGTSGELMKDYDAHLDSFATRAMQYLSEAAVAGGADPAADVDLTDVARMLGSAVVDSLRRRIEEMVGEAGDDVDALDERLRTLYRDVKVHQIGPAAQDALLSAYARGTLAGAGPSATVRWLIDSSQGPCPDALDNALQGFVVAGREFPTGHICPQAHPGCRCLLEVD